MLYKIRWNPTHPLYGALPGSYVPVLITSGALAAHRYTYVPPRCRTSQERRCFMPVWNDLGVGWRWCGVGWRVSRAGPMFFYWPNNSLHFCFLLYSLSLLSFHWLVLWGWGLRTDMVLIALSQPCIANIFY